MAEQDNIQANAPKQAFALQRFYIKDSSFESPAGPMVFTKPWKPKVQLDLNTRSKLIAEKNFEVTLTVTVTAKLDAEDGADETAFLVEVQQAGLFLVEGVEGEQLRQLLGIACPNLLFPYLREAVDSLVLKGGFPALSLQPVNFEALYRQAQKDAAEKAGTEQTAH